MIDINHKPGSYMRTILISVLLAHSLFMICSMQSFIFTSRYRLSVRWQLSGSIGNFSTELREKSNEKLAAHWRESWEGSGFLPTIHPPSKILLVKAMLPSFIYTPPSQTVKALIKAGRRKPTTWLILEAKFTLKANSSPSRKHLAWTPLPPKLTSKLEVKEGRFHSEVELHVKN